MGDGTDANPHIKELVQGEPILLIEVRFYNVRLPTVLNRVHIIF